MSDTAASSFCVSEALPLTREQIDCLQPYFQRKHEGGFMLVASLTPTGGTGSGWEMRVSAIPADRREAVRVAMTTPATATARPRRRKPAVVPFPSEPTPAA